MDVTRSMVRPLLKGLRADPLGQKPLPDLERLLAIAPIVGPTWRRQFLRIAGDAAIHESHEACLIWPVWAAAFPEAQWVIVRRRDEAIISSCLATKYMNRYDDRRGWFHWLGTIKGRFEQVRKLGAIEIWTDDIFAGDLRGLQGLSEKLSLSWKGEAVADALSPILWKSGLFEPVALEETTC